MKGLLQWYVVACAHFSICSLCPNHRQSGAWSDIAQVVVSFRNVQIKGCICFTVAVARQASRVAIAHRYACNATEAGTITTTSTARETGTLDSFPSRRKKHHSRPWANSRMYPLMYDIWGRVSYALIGGTLLRSVVATLFGGVRICLQKWTSCEEQK